MKLLSISLGSWLLGLLLLLTILSLTGAQGLSSTELNGATIVSMIVAALLFSLAYAPSLFWLRQRLGGCRPMLLFPLASA
ncbi:MAG TPA: hypothetical protein VJS17_03675, partial [Pyrinomonadaceae bacterium]|nr:hypothetical protein [Pyrinomonadaceae bacterium]